jgi:hypothetical protein
MILKIFKAVWFLSLMGWLLLFLYVYASLPEDVLLRPEGSQVLISREALFYVFLIIVSVLNAMVFIMSRLFKGQEGFLSWFYGLTICLNFFFVIVLNFLNLMNSSEKFDYTHVGYIIYGSLGLFVFWAIAWPVYSFFRKIFNKEVV